MARGPYLQKLVDISPLVIYVGVAERAAPLSAPRWTIKRIVFDATGNQISTTWTDPTAVWDNRESETYS